MRVRRNGILEDTGADEAAGNAEDCEEAHKASFFDFVARRTDHDAGFRWRGRAGAKMLRD
jgi:hypothetical protein